MSEHSRLELALQRAHEVFEARVKEGYPSSVYVFPLGVRVEDGYPGIPTIWKVSTTRPRNMGQTAFYRVAGGRIYAVTEALAASVVDGKVKLKEGGGQ